MMNQENGKKWKKMNNPSSFSRCHCTCYHKHNHACRTPKQTTKMKLHKPFERLISANQTEDKKTYTEFYAYAYICPKCDMRIVEGY